jgi:hypothetical protein
MKYLNGLLQQIDIRIKICKDIAERNAKVSFVPEGERIHPYEIV